MSKVKENVGKIKSKIDNIKKINADPKDFAKKVEDKYLKDLPSLNQLAAKKLSGLKSKLSKKRDNKNNIFSQIISIAESFIGADKFNQNYKEPNINGINDVLSRNRLQYHAINSASTTVKSFKKILSDNVKKTFFAADGVCGSNSTIPLDSIELSPKEIDFLEMFTIDPTTNVGKIIYEQSQPDLKKQKVNFELYKTFSGSAYQFNSKNSKTLFTTNWDAPTQKFKISGLTQSGVVRVDDFFTEYYSSIELPDLDYIVKNSMLQILSVPSP